MLNAPFVLLFIINEGLFRLYNSHLDSGAVNSSLINLLKPSTHNPDICTLVSRHADQCRNIIRLTANKPFRAIYRINPHANLTIRHNQLLKLSTLRTEVEVKLIILHSYFAFVVDGLLPDDFEFGEVVSKAFDDHGLNMVVGLKRYNKRVILR